MTTTTFDPQAWVGCLGCYNDGRLEGEWMSADDIGELPDRCSRCGGDEYDVFDTDGLRHPGGYYSPGAFVADVEACRSVDNIGALIEWADYLGASLPEAAESFKDAWRGEWDSMRQFIECWHEESGMLAEVPEWAQAWIDWHQAADDFEQSGEWWFSDSGHVFWLVP